MTYPIDNNEDYINVDDIPQRIKELNGQTELEDWEQDELNALCELYNDLISTFGSRHIKENNPTLVRDSYFKEYAHQEAENIVGDGLEFIDTYVNWEQYADELKIDYTTVDFDGVTYYVRG